jgi:glycerophosphoryl diester phosphodiesterase
MTEPIPFAHRGGTDGGHPENSLAAFADALARGAALETDVRLSSDGIPVLVHDAHFPRGGVPYPVRATRAATLARHGVPSLADLYQVLGTRYEVSIDVKSRAAARPAIDVARDAGARSTLWLVHGDLATLGELRVYDTEVRLVHEARPPSGGDVVATADARARELVTRGINTENRHWGSWTRAQVDAMHARDVLAFGSLVHRAGELADAASRGLDALYSDHVDALVAALSGSGA